MDKLKEYFATKKRTIKAYLDQYSEINKDDFEQVHFIGKDVLERLVHFSKQGKMLRGGLVGLGYELFNKTAKEELTAVGAALELIQSGLLIHDDIMDRDIVRRGNPSIYSQYITQAEEWKLNRPEQTGEALGICAGDAAFFLAFEIISAAKVKDTIKIAIMNLLARELSYVAVAQMVDVRRGVDSTQPDEDEILHAYIYKTGRYTFSMPLMIGGITAERSREEITKLEEIGTALGVIFQLKDDELGIFGNENELGKPVGSDIKEGKKTLFNLYLFQSVPDIKKERLSQVFGNRSASREEIEYVRMLMEENRIRDRVAAVSARFAEQAQKSVDFFKNCRYETKGLLEMLIEYNTSRNM